MHTAKRVLDRIEHLQEEVFGRVCIQHTEQIALRHNRGAAMANLARQRIGFLVLIAAAILGAAYLWFGADESVLGPEVDVATQPSPSIENEPALKGQANSRSKQSRTKKPATHRKNREAKKTPVTDAHPVGPTRLKGRIVVEGDEQPSGLRAILILNGGLPFPHPTNDKKNVQFELPLDADGYFDIDVLGGERAGLWVMSVHGALAHKEIRLRANEAGIVDLGTTKIPAFRLVHLRVHGLGQSSGFPMFRRTVRARRLYPMESRVVFGLVGRSWQRVLVPGLMIQDHSDGSKKYEFLLESEAPYSFVLYDSDGERGDAAFQIDEYVAPNHVHHWYLNLARLRLDRSALSDTVQRGGLVYINAGATWEHLLTSKEYLVSPKQSVGVRLETKAGLFETTIETPEAGRLVTWHLKPKTKTGSVKIEVRAPDGSVPSESEFHVSLVGTDPVRSWRGSTEDREPIARIDNLPIGEYELTIGAWQDGSDGALVAMDTRFEVREGKVTTVKPTLRPEREVMGNVIVALNKADTESPTGFHIMLRRRDESERLVANERIGSRAYRASLRAGEYLLHASAVGHESQELRVLIQSGGTTRVSVYLESIE